MMAQPFLATWQRTEILLLAIFAQLTLLALVGLLIARRLRQQRRTPASGRTKVRPATARPAADDPHATIRQLVSQTTGQSVRELTPLAGSVEPAHLLFREDDTRRRLLLAAGKSPGNSLKALGIRQSFLPWRRYPTHRLAPDDGAEIAAAWTALALLLDLPVKPPGARWTLVELPPEELAI
ncbi:MAG: hypothetical protein PVH17_11240 [Anaerolineae bacterium]|jgi:hypothetical protein